MKGITQDFLFGVLLTLSIVAISILVFKFSNFENALYGLILVLMATNLTVTSYYLISFSKTKLKPHERKKEIELRLKILEEGKKETKKSYYNRKISENTFNKIMQNFEQEEIMLKSELKNLKKYK